MSSSGCICIDVSENIKPSRGILSNPIHWKNTRLQWHTWSNWSNWISWNISIGPSARVFYRDSRTCVCLRYGRIEDVRTRRLGSCYGGFGTRVGSEHCSDFLVSSVFGVGSSESCGLRTRYQIQVPHTWYLVSGTKYQVPSTRYWYQVPGHLVLVLVPGRLGATHVTWYLNMSVQVERLFGTFEGYSSGNTVHAILLGTNIREAA